MPAATETLPVAVSKLSPAGTDDPVATLSTALAAVAAAPLTLSPAKALATLAAPLAPLTLATASGVATRAEASTVTVIVAVAQLVGLRISQSL